MPTDLDLIAADSDRDFSGIQLSVIIPAFFPDNKTCFLINITDDAAVEEERECFGVSVELGAIEFANVINMIDTNQECCIIDDDSETIVCAVLRKRKLILLLWKPWTDVLSFWLSSA